MLVAVRQHREEASALDGGIDLTLENRSRAGQASGDDFSVFSDKATQGVDVFLVNLFHASSSEAAKALGLEQQRLGVALMALGFV